MSSVHGDTTIILGGNHIYVEGTPDDSRISLDTSPIPISLVALDAMHDSKQRYPQPHCHPGTREAVTSLLKAWIRDRSSSCPPICWLYGTAGVGKSAIMQDLCDDLLKSSGDVRASFFFGRSQGKRADGGFLVPTLACQLAWNVWGCKERMTQLIRSKPAILNQTLSRQGALIVDSIDRPFFLSLLPASPITILIDGLDECDGEQTQVDIVTTLVDLASKSKRPLRFLIASRPENHILKTFNKSDVLPHVKRVALDETFEPSKAIRLYLTEEFARIVRENRELFGQERVWPGGGIIELLVQLADGQFIFASIVINFSSVPHTNPRQQLQIILDNTQNLGVFSSLNALYTTILSAVVDQEPLFAILACIIGSKEPPSVATISGITGFGRDKVFLVVLQLRSILKLENDFSSDEPIRIAHASFHDYLVDENRSKKYYIPNQGHTYLISRFLSYHLPESDAPPISHLQYLGLADDIPKHHHAHPIPCYYFLHVLTLFFDTYSPTPQSPRSPSRFSVESRPAFFDLLFITLLHISHHGSAFLFDTNSQTVCLGATLARRFIELGQYSPLAERKPHRTESGSCDPILLYLPVRESNSTNPLALAAMINFLSSPMLPNSLPVGFTTDRTRATFLFDPSFATAPGGYLYFITNSQLRPFAAESPDSNVDACFGLVSEPNGVQGLSGSLSKWWNLNQGVNSKGARGTWEGVFRIEIEEERGATGGKGTSLIDVQVTPFCRGGSGSAHVECLIPSKKLNLASHRRLFFKVHWEKCPPGPLETTTTFRAENPNIGTPFPSLAEWYHACLFFVTENGASPCHWSRYSSQRMTGGAVDLSALPQNGMTFLRLVVYLAKPTQDDSVNSPPPVYSNHRREIFSTIYHLHRLFES